jgi:hypothetical protein
VVSRKVSGEPDRQTPAAISSARSLPVAPRLAGAVFTGLVTILLRVALLLVLPIPDVAGHDEFSFLLQADTFAHGRLTNPTHPMWQHFESIHILQRPTCQSMYPPMQGVILAAGQLAGNPWFGMLLASGLMCGALTWMLYGYLPPEWALLGGILGVWRFGVFSYWTNGYWGGAAAALGGALLLGVLPCRAAALCVARLPGSGHPRQLAPV